MAESTNSETISYKEPNILSQTDCDSKNIAQSTILENLRTTIKEIVEYFQNNEPSCNQKEYPVDYREESHLNDHDQYMYVSRMRLLRVKALVDFNPTNCDELGFQKDDIITIISMKDEHCWTGQKDDRSGWFPSKFVKIIDERSKKYSRAGDGSINKQIIRLIKSRLCTALSDVFHHGLRRPLFLGNICHFWQFIEEASSYEVEKDYQSVISRLILCKTFRLDEEGKVLTPEELLYRCVESVNHNHNNHSMMEMKFSSLICYALNEQVLHLWWEVLCLCESIVKKWYYPWSFISSPAWVQIKCELRILSHFTFYLPVDEDKTHSSLQTKEELKREVSDMLVKHHLFSWDL